MKIFIFFSTFFAFVLSMPIYAEIGYVVATGRYRLSFQTSSNTMTVKIGKKKLLRQRDRVRLGYSLSDDGNQEVRIMAGNWETKPDHFLAGWRLSHGGKVELDVVTMQHKMHESDGMRFLGVVEGQAQPAAQYHIDNVLGGGRVWDFPFAYSLASSMSMGINFMVSGDESGWEFVYAVPLNMNSVTINGDNGPKRFVESFNAGFHSLHYLNLIQSTDGSTPEKVDRALEWKSPFYQNPNEIMEEVVNNLVASVRQNEELFTTDKLIALPKGESIDIELNYQGTVRQREDGNWYEQLAYRGILIKPLEIEAVPEDVPEDLYDEYFLSRISGLESNESAVDIIQTVKQFQKWVLSNVAEMEDVLNVAHRMRSFIVEFVKNEENTEVRQSVRMKLFYILTDVLSQHFLRISEQRVVQYDAAVQTTGESIKKIMEGNQPDIEEIKSQVRDWLNTMEENGWGASTEEVKVYLEQIDPIEMDIQSLKQHLLERLRKSSHTILESKQVFEQFELKVKMDRDLLESPEFDLEELEP